MGIKEAFGIRVRVLRDQRGLTQEQLAEAIERAVDTLSLIERGVNWPSIETVERIAQALGATAAELFDDLGTESRDGKDLFAQARHALKRMSVKQREMAVELLEVVAKQRK
jgi:transcriptional regulator with XRE-family HTH domain